MNIVVLEGSPNTHGSSNMLADAFIKGAQAKGHMVEVFDLPKMNIHPCMGCVRCGYEGPCVQHDDVTQVRRSLLSSDMVVFVTPLYYYGMSAQLKTMIDRFCAAWNDDPWTFDALEAHYDTLVRYLDLEDVGRILGRGCGTPSMTRRSAYVQQAGELGKSLDR